MNPKETPRIPLEIRREARHLLKHFPWDMHLEEVSERCSDIFEYEERREYFRQEIAKLYKEKPKLPQANTHVGSSLSGFLDEENIQIIDKPKLPKKGAVKKLRKYFKKRRDEIAPSKELIKLFKRNKK